MIVIGTFIFFCHLIKIINYSPFRNWLIKPFIPLISRPLKLRQPTAHRLNMQLTRQFEFDLYPHLLRLLQLLEKLLLLICHSCQTSYLLLLELLGSLDQVLVSLLTHLLQALLHMGLGFLHCLVVKLFYTLCYISLHLNLKILSLPFTLF